MKKFLALFFLIFLSFPGIVLAQELILKQESGWILWARMTHPGYVWMIIDGFPSYNACMEEKAKRIQSMNPTAITNGTVTLHCLPSNFYPKEEEGTPK